ncbi:MAG TPA: C-GCAxxG-C-C family protein [Streptosporangiaceae bacterium]|nr:C-GCAxxG-C-C family protein [Streptosporangiaceae bacterium]
MTGDEAVARARELFLTDTQRYGCAETTFLVLKEAYGLPDVADPSPAMALNGGVAYRGGLCGAIGGAALAVGMLAARRVANHAAAKRAARKVVAATMDAFEGEFGALDCRSLIGRDLRTLAEHRAFIESGVWRTTCMRQIEFVVRRLATLPETMPARGAAET